MNSFLRLLGALAFAAAVAVPAQAADINVGLITSMTGPGASIGIPYAKGTAAGVAYKDEVDGIKLKVIQLDDTTDPSVATRDARKLIEQDKVDVLMGSGSTPASIAITAICHELKVPCITLSPVNMPGEPGSWMISMPQPPNLMVSVVVDYMKAAGVKTVGYIGYNDGWGDLVWGGLEKSAAPDGIKILTNERYARADTSVTAQALHIVAAAPDAVMTGGSGTPGALPFIALRERGYTKEIYGTPAIINPDFIRVGGPAVEGVIASTGPVVVADQLPELVPDQKDRAGISSGLPESQQRAGARRVRSVRVRRLAGAPGFRQARSRHRRQAGDAGIPHRLARRHGHRQGRRRHPRCLQLQAGRELRRRQARTGAGEAGRRQMEACAVTLQALRIGQELLDDFGRSFDVVRHAADAEAGQAF